MASHKRDKNQADNSGQAENPLLGFRRSLVDTYYQASRDYDRAVLTLSAGALGISIAFVRDLAPDPLPLTKGWLGNAWVFLGISLLSTLTSLLTGQYALRRTIAQVDTMIREKRMEPTERPGGCLGATTSALNVCSTLALVVGIFFLALFALANI
jgi:hypothetical protein